LRSEWIIIILFVLAVLVRNKRRGFFWKAKDGNGLTIKQFLKRWKKGVEGITPLQQTKTTLWSFPLILGGITTGVVISILNRAWWLTLILCGSFPITSMQILSTWQKYKQQKKIYDTMKELDKEILENKECTISMEKDK